MAYKHPELIEAQKNFKKLLDMTHSQRMRDVWVGVLAGWPEERIMTELMKGYDPSTARMLMGSYTKKLKEKQTKLEKIEAFPEDHKSGPKKKDYRSEKDVKAFEALIAPDAPPIDTPPPDAETQVVPEEVAERVMSEEELAAAATKDAVSRMAVYAKGDRISLAKTLVFSEEENKRLRAGTKMDANNSVFDRMMQMMERKFMADMMSKMSGSDTPASSGFNPQLQMVMEENRMLRQKQEIENILGPIRSEIAMLKSKPQTEETKEIIKRLEDRITQQSQGNQFDYFLKMQSMLQDRDKSMATQVSELNKQVQQERSQMFERSIQMEMAALKKMIEEGKKTPGTDVSNLVEQMKALEAASKYFKGESSGLDEAIKAVGPALPSIAAMFTKQPASAGLSTDEQEVLNRYRTYKAQQQAQPQEEAVVEAPASSASFFPGE